MGIETAILGAGLLSAGASIWGAKKSSDSMSNAAKQSTDVQQYIYDKNQELFDPYYKVGLSALEPLTNFGNVVAPSYDKIVYDPMQSWNYQQSPSYQAKYTLGMEELNKQLQARGLASSGVGANRAADLSRRITSEDYGNERAYRLAELQKRYTGRYSEYTDRYNKLLDMVKIGQGAAGSLGQAGNQYASGVSNSALTSGANQASYYSGLPGAVMGGVSTGLRAYDYGKNAGWWNNQPNTPPLTGLDTGQDYNVYGNYGLGPSFEGVA